jgi:hypothetical protein
MFVSSWSSSRLPEQLMTQQETEFENFVVLFRKLKDWTDDDPPVW